MPARIRSLSNVQVEIAAKVINISGTGALLVGEVSLSVGVAVEIEADWPVAREHQSLILNLAGHVVRVAKRHAAVEIRRYHIRPPGKSQAAIA